jgi:hypothetical protein
MGTGNGAVDRGSALRGSTWDEERGSFAAVDAAFGIPRQGSGLHKGVRGSRNEAPIPHLPRSKCSLVPRTPSSLVLPRNDATRLNGAIPCFHVPACNSSTFLIPCQLAALGRGVALVPRTPSSLVLPSPSCFRSHREARVTRKRRGSDEEATRKRRGSDERLRSPHRRLYPLERGGHALYRAGVVNDYQRPDHRRA